jgi:hypothetical protein
VAGKEGRRVNMLQKMCTHACKCKTLWLKLSQEWEKGGMKDSDGEGESMYDICDTL